MVTIRNTIAINLTVEAVFSFLSNPANFPLWNYYIKSVERVSNGIEGVGSRFHQTRKNDDQFIVITKFENNSLIEFMSEPNSSLDFVREMIFSEADCMTHIQDCIYLDTGCVWPFEKILTHKMERAVRANLLKLKELLETGKTTLQDGRVSVFM